MKSFIILLMAAVLLSWVFTHMVIAKVKPIQNSEEVLHQEQQTAVLSSLVRSSSPQVFQLNWFSVNSGGIINASSTNYQLGLSVGQSVAGFATSTSYQMGIGFWYGVPGAPICAAAKGDLNGIGGLSPADAVLMLNCVFQNNGTGTVGGDCNPCYADVNCSGGLNPLTPADVVLELLAVFNSQPFPC